MKQFEIPSHYRSSFLGIIKKERKTADPRKKDFSPLTLDFGSVRFHIARHFGFCYGVENAIEIAYNTIENNPGRRIYMLSQMIHNPTVNSDLQDRGLGFIQDTEGNTITPWDEVRSEDIVIIPAFGTTLEMEEMLRNKGIQTEQYNTTCPFVEKVWKMANKLGTGDYSIIIHGKFAHEETRATFSHSKAESPSMVIRDIEEARIIGDIILGKRPTEDFFQNFNSRCSEGFDPERDLKRVGVINQTTMLASETHEIAEYFKQVMVEKYGADSIGAHFADTRDTLCYATNDNQQSTYELLNIKADLAIVVGGYNSSNTSHIKDLLDSKFKTYFINGASEIKDKNTIHHFDYHKKEHLISNSFLPEKETLDIVITSGASCPDSVVEGVMDAILELKNSARNKEDVLTQLSL
ncbi:MAG: 4-hydroxy-3-methylbut-2-enyl diphosphate reductase [Flavobacteriales bacterium]